MTRTRAPIDGGPSFPLRHRLFRASWNLAWFLLASWTPPPLHSWRRFLLRFFGARISNGARIYASARIWNPRDLAMGPFSCIGPRVDCYSMARITLGAYATVSQDAFLCAGSHDIDDVAFPLVAKPIHLADRAWVAAGAFVGPGVTIGEGAVLGARAVTFEDLDPWSVYIGNPAVYSRSRSKTSGAEGRRES
jgi:putative colanic acid biosynthesis acetyltransferase WcaF